MNERQRKITPGKIAGYAVPVIVSVGLCWMLFTSIDFSEMASIVRSQCVPAWIAAAMALSVASHVIRAARWGLQLRALGIRCTMWQLTLSIFGTYAVNLVFPRLGEIWRTTYISRRSGAPFTQVFGSMVADRMADMLTVLLLVLLTFLLASAHVAGYLGESVRSLAWAGRLLTSPWLWGAFFLLAAATAIYVSRGRGPVASKLRDIIAGLWRGFAVIAVMPGRGRWLLLTFGVWGCYWLQLYLAFFAFPFTAALAGGTGGAVAVLVVFCLSSIAMGVPSNGGIGPWQWAVIFALGTYGVAPVEAGAFANLVLGSQTLLLIALGILTFACITISNHRKK